MQTRDEGDARFKIHAAKGMDYQAEWMGDGLEWQWRKRTEGRPNRDLTNSDHEAW